MRLVLIFIYLFQCRALDIQILPHMIDTELVIVVILPETRSAQRSAGILKLNLNFMIHK